MLLKHRISKYASLLLVLFLIFQVIPSTFANAESFDSHAQKSTVIFSTSAVHTDVAFLATDGRKTPFHPISADIYDCIIEHVYVVDISKNELAYYETLVDIRKEIRQKILNYFHGSKYK